MKKGEKAPYGKLRIRIRRGRPENSSRHRWFPYFGISLRDRMLCNRPWHPMPSFIGDPDQRKHRFDKWCKLTEKVGWRVVDLYWRVRPEKHRKLKRG